MKKMMTCMMAFMLSGCASGYNIVPIKKQIASDLNYILQSQDCVATCDQVKAYIKTKLADYQSK